MSDKFTCTVCGSEYDESLRMFEEDDGICGDCWTEITAEDDEIEINYYEEFFNRKENDEQTKQPTGA